MLVIGNEKDTRQGRAISLRKNVLCIAKLSNADAGIHHQTAMKLTILLALFLLKV